MTKAEAERYSMLKLVCGKIVLGSLYYVLFNAEFMMYMVNAFFYVQLKLWEISIVN